jgi:hypothetical protein
MALAVEGVSLLVILAALAAALIDKETVRESVIRLHELARRPRELSSPRMARSSTSISESPSFPRYRETNYWGRESSETCWSQPATLTVPSVITASKH